MSKVDILAKLARDRRDRQALLARLEQAAVPGSEWTNEGQRLYLVVTRAMRGAPEALCLRRFDARGFSGHATRACAAAAAAEIVEWLGTGVQPAPGALERLAPTFDVTAPRIVLTRPTRTSIWAWHEQRLYGLPQDADQIRSRASQAGLEAQVVGLPPGPWADARAAAQALLSRWNAGGSDAA